VAHRSLNRKILQGREKLLGAGSETVSGLLVGGIPQTHLLVRDNGLDWLVSEPTKEQNLVGRPNKGGLLRPCKGDVVLGQAGGVCCVEKPRKSNSGGLY